MNIKMKYPDTIKLNISSNSINNCKKVAILLQQNGILSNITPNFSIVDKNNQKIIENGCNIVLTNTSLHQIDHIWKKIKKEYSLNCAHLEIENKYKGCIYNFFSENNCPG